MIRLIPVAVAAAATVALTVPAQAAEQQTVSVRDPRGDVILTDDHGDPPSKAPHAASDLFRVTVHVDKSAATPYLRAAFTVRKVFTGTAGHHTTYRLAFVQGKGKVVIGLLGTPRSRVVGSDGTAVSCPLRVRADADTDRVVARVPLSCLEDGGYDSGALRPSTRMVKRVNQGEYTLTYGDRGRATPRLSL